MQALRRQDEMKSVMRDKAATFLNEGGTWAGFYERDTIL